MLIVKIRGESNLHEFPVIEFNKDFNFQNLNNIFDDINFGKFNLY